MSKHKYMCNVQKVGEDNVEYRCGPGKRGPGWGEESVCVPQAPLFTLYATKDIEVGDELLTNYGPAFWND
jgi:hypothetical protein